MVNITYWLDEFYELPESLQRKYIEECTTVIREWIVIVFLDEEEYEQIDLDELF